jgi:predicted MPP superfamily phosphohydrolase
MTRLFGMLIFLSIFLGICFGGYYYVLSRLFFFFKLKHNIFFWLILVFLAFGYAGFSILEIRFPCSAWGIFLRLSAIGIGVGWLCLVIIISHDLMQLVFKFPISISRWVVLGLIVSLTIYSLINAMRLQIKTIEIPAPVEKRIAHWSDVHLGSVSRRHLEHLVQKTNTLNPDLVLITGDLVDPQGNLSSDWLTPLNKLTAPAYCVTGNHERYVGLDKVMSMLETTPVIPLRNEVVLFDSIQLVGIDDSDNRDQVRRHLAGLELNPDMFTVLLYHQPEGFNDAETAGVDLMLSGHTHYGQIWPFHRMVRLRFKYLKGLHTIGDMKLYVSTGSGTWGPPMRLGSRNLITLIRLVKE